MNKNIKGLIAISFSSILIFISYQLGKALSPYAILSSTVAIVLLLYGLGCLLQSNKPEKVYNKTVKKILNTYDSILVKVTSNVSLKGKNIVELTSIDDLIDAQLELKKPICYLKQTESCSFLLMDTKEVYIYIERVNDQVVSPFDADIKQAKKKKKKKEAEIFKDIDETTIINLSDKKSFKVTPVRKLNNRFTTGQYEEVEVL